MGRTNQKGLFGKSPKDSKTRPTTAMSVNAEDEIESIALVEGENMAAVSTPGDSEPTSADYYFDSYSHFGIHEEMIKDSVRTRTYQNAILQNHFLFKDKIVLDVGAGTGILSLFAAQAGAKHVYAVECSLMADTAEEIVSANGFSDVITVLKGRVEEIDLPIKHVDVIVSEWMGYFLLFENMLNTVLYARDKWLVPSGIVLPDKTSLYLTAIEDADYKAEKIDFWNSVYGFDMSCIRKQAMREPLVDTVDSNQIVTDSHLLKTMDISKMRSGDASFMAPFKLVATKNDFVHALVAYFDVCFSKCHKPTSFSTGPKSRATHWKQTVMYLEDVITICEGEAITGKLSVAPNASNPRDLDVTVHYSFTGKRALARHGAKFSWHFICIDFSRKSCGRKCPKFWYIAMKQFDIDSDCSISCLSVAM
ncbi:hypothetical protein R1flu_008510 [Riccia fluitans]|uniref:Protein arginine N-methyltransferase domain-containing protein n=1 Tax=Riccia fluitans TaxID=41844 RepID=A0ABD1YC37_9MARC